MFDIGFWELSIIALVSLLVIGPERLPKVARLTGFWIGKARRLVSSVKQEIKEELHAEELRQTLTDYSPDTEIRNLLDDTSEVVESISEAGKDMEKSSQSTQPTQSTSRSQQPHGEQ